MTLAFLIKAAQDTLKRGEYLASVTQWRSAVGMAEMSDSVTALDLAAILNGLGLACKGCGSFEEGERAYRRALTLVEAALDSGAAQTAGEIATIYHNLAGLEHARGQCAVGEPLARRGMAIRERLVGADHVETAKDAAALAALLDGQGKFEESEPLHRLALAIFERELGPDHIETGIELGNLAALESSQGRWDAAVRHYERALDIKLRHLGPAHPSVGWTLNNMAVLKRTQGQPDAAKEYFARALAILELALGKEHRRVVTCRANYESVRAPREGHG
jgi:tetratricopeptide (TPR) repeat protein